MLSPSTPTRKNLSEEDSSGSDAGSEVSLEPETDRFGFILGNGSTAGTLGPPPELVRQRETKWINIIQQWDRILLRKTSKVKLQCQKGIPASLRAKCWPLLCGATDKMKQNENLYQTLDSKPALQSWVDVIERDLDRQFPFHEMFLSKDGHGQRGLFRVLKAYTQYQPEEGYCQAQGPVAAVLLMNMPAEEAFWCLAQISEQYLPGYYSPLLEGVLFDAAMLSWVLKRTCPAVHKHLQHHGVEPLMFATDWLMCLFTRHLPFNTLLRVWDLFFCYGVRVLLQVAVVLVRRVLGRAEQRKQCQGQMETLEKLRGVREQVQEEDDTFIAEVCSVPLSTKDLEKRTVKELEKWRKDKPSSTFDPTGRCYGFQMAWARARKYREEQERKERQTGNLSVPLARSASTLSLSPSLLHKRWKKGGKSNTGDWEGGGKVVRHLSMGAREDLTSWTDYNFKKVQDVEEEEDIVSDEYKKQTEPNLEEKTEVKEVLEEPIKTDTIHSIPEVHIEETVIVNELTENVETEICKNEGRETLSEHTEETNVAVELHQGHSSDQSVDNTLPQPSENAPQHQQEEDGGTCSQPKVEEQPDHQAKGQDTEVKHLNEQTQEQFNDIDEMQEEQLNDLNEDREKQINAIENETEKEVGGEGEQMAAPREVQGEKQTDAAADTNQETPKLNEHVPVDSNEEQITEAEMKPSEGLETNDAQQTQVDTELSETRTDTSPGTETESNFEEMPIKDPELTPETQKQQEELITETIDTSLEGDGSEAGHSSPKFLAEIEIEETHPQMETDMEKTETQGKVGDNVPVPQELETEVRETNTESEAKMEAETLILPSPECPQKDECADTGKEEVTCVIESSETLATCAEKACDTVACELTQEGEKLILTVHVEESVEGDHTEEEETPSETQTKVVDADLAAPLQKEEAGNLTTKSELRKKSEDKSVEEHAQEDTGSQIPVENIVEEDSVFISTPDVTDRPHGESIPQVEEKDSSQAEITGQTHVSGRRSSRSSADFCVRRSSNSNGSRLARRLSEDLFTCPQKDSQSQASPSQELPHVESQPDPGAVTQTPTEVTQSPKVKPPLTSLPVTEKTTAQQEPQASSKRFGLFRRLREQPKKAKEKDRQKMQVPKILIQDFSDGTGKPVEEEEKLSSRERRRRRREQERKEKEEERLRKKKEKESEKERERERRKPQTRGKSFQVPKESKASDDVPLQGNTGSKTFRNSTSYSEAYF